MNLPSKVKIREVGPRDGFQSWPDFVPTENKLEILELCVQAGVTSLESTSFVSPKAIPQLADAAEVIKNAPRRDGCSHAALVPNLKGAQLALEAGADELVGVISVTDQHNMANIKRTVDESLAGLKDIIAMAKDRGVPVIGAMAVSFGCPYQGDVPPEQVFKVAEAFLGHGAASLLLADTTGMATPPRIQDLVGAFVEKFPGVPFGLHLHNNRGTAMANLMAALEVGATCFDTALGGIGGCPNVPLAAGNLPTEDVVYMLEDMGVETGIDLAKIIKAAHRLEEILGKTLPGQVMKSGPRDPKLAAELCGVH